MAELLDDLKLVQQLVRALPEDGPARLWSVHMRYLDAAPLRRGETASIDCRMRLLCPHVLET